MSVQIDSREILDQKPLLTLREAAVYTGIIIEITLITVLIAGFAGIPGIILLVLSKFL